MDLLAVVPRGIGWLDCRSLDLPVPRLLELLELLVQILCHHLERLAVALARLRVSDPSDDLVRREKDRN